MINAEVREKILRAVDEKREEAIGFLRDLVRTPSFLGEERAAQRMVESKFKSMGMKLDVFEPNIEEIRQHPEYTPVEFSEAKGYKNRPNVVGTLSGTGGGRSVILSGHIDTVPTGPRELWKHDPLSATIEAGRMYGRGTADDKGGIAVFTAAVDSLLAAGVKLKGDLTLGSVIEEEEGGSGGTLALVLRGYRANGAIYPHPLLAGLAGLYVSLAGTLSFRVKVTGKIEEYPTLGVNAIEKAIKIFQALKDLDERRGLTMRYPLFEKYFQAAGYSPATTRITNLIPAIIKGGDYPVQVPGSCMLECSITFPPTETVEGIKDMIETYIRKVGEADVWMRDHPPEIEWVGWKCSPAEVDPKHPIVETVRKHIHDVAGIDAEPQGLPIFGDPRFYIKYANTPTVCIGPLGGQLHGADEWVDLEDLVKSVKIVALSITDWCGYES